MFIKKEILFLGHKWKNFLCRTNINNIMRTWRILRVYFSLLNMRESWLLNSKSELETVVLLRRIAPN